MPHKPTTSPVLLLFLILSNTLFLSVLAASNSALYCGTTVAGWLDIRRTIYDLVQAGHGPLLVRLAWHDAGTFSQIDGKGGMHAMMRFSPVSDWGANKGLDLARGMLSDLSRTYPNVSVSDIWALAGSVAVTGTGGPLLPFRCGRVDYGPGQGVPPPRLPDATRGEDHLRDVFITNMGFDEWELVALSGAHSLGRAHSDRSGFDGPWTRRPNTFSNSYFGILTDTRPFRPITAPNNNTQFVYSDSQLMMLPSDMALVESNALRYYVYKYAANSTLFFDVFARAWVKLVELGYPPTSLTLLPISTDPLDTSTTPALSTLSDLWTVVPLGPSMALGWKVRAEDGWVDLKLACRCAGWFALGFGESMADLDVMAYPGGGGPSGLMLDMYTRGYAAPMVDSVQSLSDIHDASVEFPGFTRAVGFSRQLDTGDVRHDHVLSVVGPLRVHYVWSESDTIVYHGENVDSTTLDLTSGTAAEDNSKVPSRLVAVLKGFHGIVLFGSFSIVGPAAIVIVRYSSRYPDYLIWHREVMSILVTESFVDIMLTMVIKIGKDDSNPHVILGKVLLAVMLLQVVLGFVASPSAPEYLSKMGIVGSLIRQNLMQMRAMHRLVGYVMTLFMMANAFLGMSIYMRESPNLLAFQISFVVLVFSWVFILVGVHEWRNLLSKITGRDWTTVNRIGDELETGKDDNAGLMSISWKEFNDRTAKGAKLVIIEGIVYDIGEYAVSHPGGAAPLMQTVGLDITSFFNGDSVVTVTTAKGKSKPVSHEHSRVAHFQLRKMKVAKIEQGTYGQILKSALIALVPNRSSLESPTGAAQLQETEFAADSVLSSHVFRYFKLAKKMPVSETKARKKVILFSFELKDANGNFPQNPIIFKPGEHCSIQLVSGVELITRAYTPISIQCQNSIEFMIKLHPEGKMSKLLQALEVGDQARIMSNRQETCQNPIERMRNLNHESLCFRSVGMICQGTGLVPFIKIIEWYSRCGLRLPKSKTGEGGMPLFTLRLLDVVETDHDIFARNHIDALQADLKGALRVTTLAIAPSPEWTGLRGNLTEEVLAGAIEPPEQAAPKPLSRRNSYMHHNSQVSLPGVSGNSIKMQQPQLEGSRIFVCGTKRFKSMVTEMLLTLGYMESVIVELA